jgi:hypothetical protein
VKGQLNVVGKANMKLELIQVDKYQLFGILDHYVSSEELVKKA